MIFWGKQVEHNVCVLIFSTVLLEKFLVLRRVQRDTIVNIHRSSCKVPVNLVRVWWKLNFLSTKFRKILKYRISWKYVQWQPSFSMRTDGQTDMAKLIVAFRNFANAPKIWSFYTSNVVCILICQGLNDWWGSIFGNSRNFSLCLGAQTGSEACSTSHPQGTDKKCWGKNTSCCTSTFPCTFFVFKCMTT